jgi:hypothetical protein
VKSSEIDYNLEPDYENSDFIDPNHGPNIEIWMKLLDVLGNDSYSQCNEMTILHQMIINHNSPFPDSL